MLHQFFGNCTKRQKVFHLSFFKNHYSLCLSEIQCSIYIFFFCGSSPHFLALAFPICFLQPAVFHAGANPWHPSKQHSPKKYVLFLENLTLHWSESFWCLLQNVLNTGYCFIDMKRYVSRTWNINCFLISLYVIEKIQLKLCLCLIKHYATKVCKIV